MDKQICLRLTLPRLRSSIFESKLTAKINIFPINFMFTGRVLLVVDRKRYAGIESANAASDPY